MHSGGKRARIRTARYVDILALSPTLIFRHGYIRPQRSHSCFTYDRPTEGLYTWNVQCPKKDIGLLLQTMMTYKVWVHLREPVLSLKVENIKFQHNTKRKFYGSWWNVLVEQWRILDEVDSIQLVSTRPSGDDFARRKGMSLLSKYLWSAVQTKSSQPGLTHAIHVT